MNPFCFGSYCCKYGFDNQNNSILKTVRLVKIEDGKNES